MEEDSNSYPPIIQDWNDPQSYNLQELEYVRNFQATSNQNKFDDLYQASHRFKDFIDNIKQLAFTPIREDILLYCSGQKKSERCIDNVLKPECLYKKMEIRIDKMIKTKRIKRNWGEEDLKILIWVVSKYCDLRRITDIEREMTSEDWKFIASIIPGVTAETCMFKWLSIKKITLATHNWTKEESELLSNLVRQRLGRSQSCKQIKDWKEISQDLYRLNENPHKVYRNAKQCRQHWTCYLSPQLKKGPWQLYEDIKLLKFIQENKGLKKWSQIAKNFQGRTENALKNRYTLIIQKQKRIPRNKQKSQLTLICQYLQKCQLDQYTSNNIKMETSQNEQSSIYQEEEVKDHIYEEVRSDHKREENMNYDTNQSVITPVRVQKFNINDFQSMNFHFFRNIQPGVIESNGKFKKISSTLSFKEQVTSEKQDKNRESKKQFISQIQKKGPFTIFPLQD